MANNWLSNDQENIKKYLKESRISKTSVSKSNRIQSAHQSRDQNRTNLDGKFNNDKVFSLLDTEKVNKIFTTEDLSYIQGEINMTESICKPKGSIISGYS